MATAPEKRALSKPAAMERAELSIRFLKQFPDEDLVHYVRMCASRLVHDGVLEVTIERHRYGTQVTLQGSSSPYPVIETDRDPYLAVRNGFARWDATLGVEARVEPASPDTARVDEALDQGRLDRDRRDAVKR